MTLVEALAESIWKLTHPYGGHHDLDDADELYYSPNELAETLLRDPAFRAALTEAIFAAFREDMSQPGYGYIDFSWRPQSEGDDSDGGREAHAWAEAIAAHLTAATTTADTAPTPEHDAPHG